MVDNFHSLSVHYKHNLILEFYSNKNQSKHLNNLCNYLAQPSPKHVS